MMMMVFVAPVIFRSIAHGWKWAIYVTPPPFWLLVSNTRLRKFLSKFHAIALSFLFSLSLSLTLSFSLLFVFKAIYLFMYLFVCLF